MSSTVVSMKPRSAKSRSADRNRRSRISVRRRSRRPVRGVMTRRVTVEEAICKFVSDLNPITTISHLWLELKKSNRRVAFAPMEKRDFPPRRVLPSGAAVCLRLIREVLRAALVERGGQELRGRRNRNGAVQRDILGVQLLPVDAFVGVVIGTKRRAFERNAGKEAACSRIRENFRAHGDVRVRFRITSHRP